MNKAKKFVIRKIVKARKDRKFNRISGRLVGIPKEWIGKHCVVIPLTKNERVEIYGKIRTLYLIDRILFADRKKK